MKTTELTFISVSGTFPFTNQLCTVFVPGNDDGYFYSSSTNTLVTGYRRFCRFNDFEQEAVDTRSDISKNAGTAAVLFDLDGTLVDTVYEHVLAWTEALARFGIQVPDWRVHRLIGMPGKLFLPVLFREIGQKSSGKTIEKLENCHRHNFARRIPRVRLHAGSKELLSELSQLTVPRAIATSGDKKTVMRFVKMLGVEDDVPVITSEDIERPKPSPNVFAAAAARLGMRLSDSIIVGDVWDVLSAARAKALGVGVLCGGYGESELQEAGAFRVYRDPADLLNHLEEVGVRA